MDARSAIKGVMERALIWSGAAAIQRRRMIGETLVLAYHNVVPDGTPPVGDLANHLPLSRFAAQLDALAKTHDVVALTDLALPSTGRRPRAIITFDDAYQGAVIHGVAALVERRMPATIFVAPGFIGGQSFWWDALADVQGAGLDAPLRDRALGELRGEDTRIRDWAARADYEIHDVPVVACAATEAELLASAAAPGITLGSHTWSHPNLARLDVRSLPGELARPLEWLRARTSKVVPWIAYPYGLYNAAVTNAVRELGYAGGLAISGGWSTNPPADPFAVPRVNIAPGMSRRGFELRGAGLLS